MINHLMRGFRLDSAANTNLDGPSGLVAFDYSPIAASSDRLVDSALWIRRDAGVPALGFRLVP